MIRMFIFVAASPFALGACAGPALAAAPSASLLAAHLMSERLVVSLAGDPHASAARAAVRPLSPAALTRVEAANRDAVREPDPANFLGAIQVYPWNEGALYRLYAAPGTVSDIALEPGEALVSVAAGDTLRWVIGDTSSGAGAARRTHILVKPSTVGLATNLVIATDRRTYHVNAKSDLRTAMAGIAWTYAEDALMAVRGTAPAAGPVSSGVPVEALNFGYRIEGDDVPWRPVRAFDDGQQVFIQFPPALSQGEAPPLFVTGDKGRAELVNYRVRGLYYVVDRLFARAELRMGEKHQQMVRIIRASAGNRGGRNQ